MRAQIPKPAHMKTGGGMGGGMGMGMATGMGTGMATAMGGGGMGGANAGYGGRMGGEYEQVGQALLACAAPLMMGLGSMMCCWAGGQAGSCVIVYRCMWSCVGLPPIHARTSCELSCFPASPVARWLLATLLVGQLCCTCHADPICAGFS